jgi:hypothetical protein
LSHDDRQTRRSAPRKINKCLDVARGPPQTAFANRWTIAQPATNRTPDRMQRLPNRASWDTPGAMSEVRSR